MIPNETLQTIDTVGDTAVVGNFKITNATQARILVSLSDKMYTRKQLAAVREYSTNAADAHRVVGKPISEIVVTLPVLTDLNLRIRDFGTGLTEEQIRDVYCIFGESTKRNSNEFNGLLGYGCKAGFASADSFIVTSWINGEKTVYQCIKGDSTKLHTAIRLSKEASAEPTGIEITIPVKQSDMWTFHREAVDFYKYWPEMPTLVNLTEDETNTLTKFRSVAATLKGEGWEIRPAANGARGIAYMGWVPYQIDWNTLYHRMSLDSKKRVLFDLLQKNDVTLYFKMGEVQFVDSREHLEYTDLTLKALMDRIQNIFDKIKDAIQEKFTDLTNIWDAKKMYNAIFGTGVLELEKGELDDADMGTRIKILDGNLMHLESTFRDQFTWNGIIINGPDFDKINRFDNAQGTSIGTNGYFPAEPVMITYRKKKSRAKVNRCKPDANNRIVASNSVAIVLNDTGSRSGQSMVSRYLIFGTDKNIKTVHVLSFKDAAIQDAFNAEYNFHSVPVQKLSELLPLAKAWNNTHKISRSYGGGGGGTRTMYYMDIEKQSVEESEVPIREIEEGNFYVEVGNGRTELRKNVKINELASEDPEDVVQYIHTLVETLDLDIERVYIISKQSSNSKWFKEAIASGDWINLWSHIKENLSDLDVDSLLKSRGFSKMTIACKKSIDYLKDKIIDKNSPMLAFFNVTAPEKYEDNMRVISALQNCRLWSEVCGDRLMPSDYIEIKKRAEVQYPLLNWSWIHDEYYADDENLKRAIDYINAMDLYIDLTSPTVVKQPTIVEGKAKEEVAA